MSFQDGQTSPTSEGAGFTWILEHLLTYPATYEIPLRTMYTLNSASQNPPLRGQPTNVVVGNAFPTKAKGKAETSNTSTATAAAQLRANLMTHIAQQPSQPTSLPPSFITNFVRRCFAPELDQVDFPQALTAMDYLKDLETRRRNEVIGALHKLGVDPRDFSSRESLTKKYPGVLRWIENMEEKERRVETLYTHVYLGLRRWTLINEMSLVPLNKPSCHAMLNTLYPPIGPNTSQQPSQPAALLTPQVLTTQRNGFFRYITAVERNGPTVLASLINQHKRQGEETGWPKVREDLDNYLRAANAIIDECLEITGRGLSPVTPSSISFEEEEHKRKIDSGISFASGYSSNRSSGQSHSTHPSTSSSVSGHSRHASKEKAVDKHLSTATEGDETVTVKPAGSTLERIARELRKIGSRPAMREEPAKSRPTTPHAQQDAAMPDGESPPATPGRGLRLKRSIRNMRSSSRARSNSASRPISRSGSNGHTEDVPAFDPEEMRRRRDAWEASQQRGRQ